MGVLIDECLCFVVDRICCHLIGWRAPVVEHHSNGVVEEEAGEPSESHVHDEARVDVSGCGVDELDEDWQLDHDQEHVANDEANGDHGEEASQSHGSKIDPLWLE